MRGKPCARHTVGQDRETERRRAAFLDGRQFVDPGGWRTFAAALQHFVNACPGAGEQRLDRAVAPVAYPAVESQALAVRSVQAR